MSYTIKQHGTPEACPRRASTIRLEVTSRRQRMRVCLVNRHDNHFLNKPVCASVSDPIQQAITEARTRSRTRPRIRPNGVHQSTTALASQGLQMHQQRATRRLVSNRDEMRRTFPPSRPARRIRLSRTARRPLEGCARLSSRCRDGPFLTSACESSARSPALHRSLSTPRTRLGSAGSQCCRYITRKTHGRKERRCL